MGKSTATSLYRYYDNSDVLLYAGITGRGVARNAEHNKTKGWWSFVARQEVDHFSSRDRALKVERETIVKYRPPFNRQHNPDHEETRNAYLKLRALGAATGTTAAGAAVNLSRQDFRRFKVEVTRIHDDVIYLEPEAPLPGWVDLSYEDPKFTIGSGGRKAQLLGAVRHDGSPEIRVRVKKDARDCTGGVVLTKVVGRKLLVMKRIDLGFWSDTTRLAS